MRKYIQCFLILLLFGTITLFVAPALMADGGNTYNDSFPKAKEWLLGRVYTDHRTTVYCEAEFMPDKTIILPQGFKTDKYQARAHRLEWEHIVPAENFGRTFPEWRDGHPDCIDKSGKPFKGRKCAELANKSYRLMQADMYNLYPAIGAVNASRQNYNFIQFQDDTKSSFGSCLMKIHDRKAEPPTPARGVIARTYLYFEDAYSRYRMSDSQRNLMQAWDRLYPVTEWECERSCRIYNIQKNKNKILEKRCKGIWEC